MMPSTKSKNKPKPKAYTFSFEAIGTQWVMELNNNVFTEALQSALLKRVDEFDKTYSRFRSDSFVTSLSHQTGTITLPYDMKPLLDLYAHLYKVTNGKVTPLIGQTLSDAGYDAEYSLKPGQLVQPPNWESTLYYNDTSITMHKPALLDFGAAGKGYLVDLLADMLKSHDITSFVINAGGDIFIYNSPEPLQVGLENPHSMNQVIGIAEMQNGSICGSAGNRRAWANFTHILDPEQLNSPSHIIATWITAETTMLADGLSTALYFTEPEILQTAYNFEYAIVYAGLTLKKSKLFPAKFFTSKENA